MPSKQHDIIVDILKGIGIISVVMGHSGRLFPFQQGSSIAIFLYFYHIMVFFFVTGMTFHPGKYSDPFQYIGKQLKSAAPLYVGYNLGFLALHNLFSRIQLIDIPSIGINDFIISGVHIFTFKHTELLTGALWFVPMFLFAKVFFSLGFFNAERLRLKYIGHLAVVVVTGLLGLYCTSMGMSLHFNMQISLLGVPIIYLGYIFRAYQSRLDFLMKPYSLIGSFLLLCTFVYTKIGIINLSENQIISVYWFYPITIVGMIFCISFAEFLRRFSVSSRLIGYIGSISFHIMALHFLIFKCYDFVVGKYLHTDPAVRMRFPTAFEQNGWLYSLLGIGIPALFIWAFRKIRSRQKAD